MRLTVVSSSSAGNCYVLQGRSSALVIECGVRPEAVMRRVRGLDWSKLAGVLVTHEHGDHAGFMKRWMDLGIDIWASYGTFEAKGMEKEMRARRLHAMTTQLIGDEWLVKSFDVRHDAREPYGFIIEHREVGKILFATDTRCIPYSFRSQELDHIMVEANYDDAILMENVNAEQLLIQQAARVQGSHMSIRSACDFIREHQSGNLKTVTLLHLSSQNADAERFRRMAEDSVLFAKVYVAKPGLQVEIVRDEFEIK